VEANASGYVMGVVLMQGGKLVCYHFEMFHGKVLNYLTYDKDVNVYAIIIVLCISLDKSIIRTRSPRNTHSRGQKRGIIGVMLYV
jgi:hypothetical protein